MQTMTEEMQGKKRFAKFLYCFDCRVLQEIYQKQRQKDEQGWFEKIKGVECQYKGVLISTVVVISRETDVIWKWMEDDLIEHDNADEVYKQLGRKIMWGGLEATKLCKVFYGLTQMVKE